MGGVSILTIIAGTAMKSDITAGNKTVETINIFARTRCMYSRLTTVRNFFMQVQSLS